MPLHPSPPLSISDSIVNWNSSVRSWLHNLEICAFKNTTVEMLLGAWEFNPAEQVFPLNLPYTGSRSHACLHNLE